MVRRYSSFKAFVLLYSITFSWVSISCLAQMAPPMGAGGAPDASLSMGPAPAAPPAVGQPVPQPETMNIPAGGGPETVDLSEDKVGTHGNWMKKRDWLIKTNEANAELQELVMGINAIRQNYNDQYRGIDEILDEFYKQLGQEQGKLQEFFDDIIRYLEKKKKKEVTALASLSPEQEKKSEEIRKIDRNLQDKIDLIEQQISTLKSSLEQLKLDTKSVEDLDKSITERMKKVDEQIGIANEEAAIAQKKTNDLWYIIDDKKARTYYYEIKGSSLEKIKAIDVYLKGDLLTDFGTVIDTVKTHIAKTQDDIKKLEDKGIIIKDRARRVEELKLKDLKDAELERKNAEIADKKAAAEKIRKAKRPKTWYGQLYQAVVNFFSSMVTGVADFFASLYQNIVGGKKVTPKKITAPKPSAPQTPTNPTHETLTTLPAPTPQAPTTSPINSPADHPEALPQPAAPTPVMPTT